MHVLVLPSWYPTAERPQAGVYLAEQARALQQRGLRMGVVYPEHRSLRRLSWETLRANWFQRRCYCEDGLPTLRRHSWNVLWRLPQSYALRIRHARGLVRHYVRRFGRPDLLHAHSARWAGAAAARIGASLGAPYLLTEHYSGFLRGDVPDWQRRLAREGFENARRVLAVSTALQDALLRHGLVDPVRTEVLPNMVDTGFFTLPPNAPPSGTGVRFFALGQLKRGKGLDVLLDAFARAFAQRPGVWLEIGGEGPERARLERQAERLGLCGRVSFLGRLSRQDVRAALWRANALVHPSLQETFGVVLIEAMATGLPVVATACGGPEDIVTPETGLLVPPGDVSALAEGLRAMAEQRTFFDASGIRAYIESTFASQKIAERLAGFYRSAVMV